MYMNRLSLPVAYALGLIPYAQAVTIGRKAPTPPPAPRPLLLWNADKSSSYLLECQLFRREGGLGPTCDPTSLTSTTTIIVSWTGDCSGVYPVLDDDGKEREISMDTCWDCLIDERQCPKLGLILDGPNSGKYIPVEKRKARTINEMLGIPAQYSLLTAAMRQDHIDNPPTPKVRRTPKRKSTASDGGEAKKARFVVGGGQVPFQERSVPGLPVPETRDGLTMSAGHSQPPGGPMLPTSLIANSQAFASPSTSAKCSLVDLPQTPTALPTAITQSVATATLSDSPASFVISESATDGATGVCRSSVNTSSIYTPHIASPSSDAGGNALQAPDTSQGDHVLGRECIPAGQDDISQATARLTEPSMQATGASPQTTAPAIAAITSPRMTGNSPAQTSSRPSASSSSNSQTREHQSFDDIRLILDMVQALGAERDAAEARASDAAAQTDIVTKEKANLSTQLARLVETYNPEMLKRIKKDRDEAVNLAATRLVEKNKAVRDMFEAKDTARDEITKREQAEARDRTSRNLLIEAQTQLQGKHDVLCCSQK